MKVLNKYGVGEVFPHEQYLNKGEVTVAMLNHAFFDVVCVLKNVTKQEVKEWRKGKLSVYLYENENIPYFCLDFGTWSLDVNINMNKVKADYVDAWLNSESNLINLFLVEESNGILNAMRTITIPVEIEERIRDLCEVQTNFSVNEIDLRIQKTLSKYSTKQMINKADLSYKLK